LAEALRPEIVRHRTRRFYCRKRQGSDAPQPGITSAAVLQPGVFAWRIYSTNGALRTPAGYWSFKPPGKC